MPTFHQHTRRVIDPIIAISVRHTELVFCLRKLAEASYFGSVKDGDYKAFCRAQRYHFNRRFGFDDTVPPRPEQLVKALAFAYAEYNKLRRVQQVIYRRRVGQKMLGRRFASKKEWAYATVLWREAVEQYLDNLKR